jgi:hypothetical protein
MYYFDVFLNKKYFKNVIFTTIPNTPLHKNHDLPQFKIMVKWIPRSLVYFEISFVSTLISATQDLACTFDYWSYMASPTKFVANGVRELLIMFLLNWERIE